jgi:hypothetical protein
MNHIPRLVVHVGTQKTGSTSLQKAMRDSAEEMRRNGILYPSLSRGGHPFKHIGVFRAIEGNQPKIQAAEAEAFVREFEESGCHTMLISEEALWRSELNPGPFFRRFQPRFTIDVVVCLRRPDLYLESLYSQTLRTGLADECRDVSAFAADPQIKGRLGYASLLEKWRRTASRVVALDFDAAVRTTGLFAAFFEAAGLPAAAVPGEVHEKPSPDMNIILALRTLRERGWPHSMPQMLGGARKLRELDNLPARKHILGSRLRRQILTELSLETQKLSEQWGIRFSEELPEEPPDPQAEPDAVYMLALAGLLSAQNETRDGKEGAGKNKGNGKKRMLPRPNKHQRLII